MGNSKTKTSCYKTIEPLDSAACAIRIVLNGGEDSVIDYVAKNPYETCCDLTLLLNSSTPSHQDLAHQILGFPDVMPILKNLGYEDEIRAIKQNCGVEEPQQTSSAPILNL